VSEPGKLISFEGGEGAGKSTQCRMLAEYLKGRGLDVVLTREPGGTEGAEAIRQLLVTGEAGRWDALSELYLLNAARRDHVERFIKPELSRGTWVITDRYVDSTRVYQGVGKGIADSIVLRHHAEATGDLWPALTVLLDLAPQAGLARTQSRTHDETRFEGESLQFHKAIREGFLSISEQEPIRVAVVDASKDVASVQADIRQAVSSHLGV
jgi:dTMP kinase